MSDFAELREAEKKATAGPWRVKEYDAGELCVWSSGLGQICEIEPVASSAESRANAALIARARNDVPLLLAELDRLTAALAEANATIDRLRYCQCKPYLTMGVSHGCNCIFCGLPEKPATILAMEQPK